MKVCLIGPSLEQKGGIVSVCKGIIGHLQEEEIEVLYLPTTSYRGFIAGVLRFIYTFCLLSFYCLTGAVHVVHLHMASRGSTLRKCILASICWLSRTPFLIHLHGGEFRDFFSNELKSYQRRALRYIFGKSSTVIALSATWNLWLTRELGLANVITISNGVPSLEITKSPISTPRILFLGNLCKGKGVDDLLAAMFIVQDKIPDAALELGGDGPIDVYGNLAQGLNNVAFLGWIDDEARRAALSRANLYCLPSWNEGLPMSVLEAMSAGLPIVSTPVGGVPEAVTDGLNGFLVEPGDVVALADRLVTLLSDPSLAEGMGSRSKLLHEQKFSRQAMGQACINAYKSCLQK